MTQRRRIMLVFPLLVVVALVSACAAQSPKAAAQTHAASPHPTPTAHTASEPTVRVPFGCASLFAAPTISGMVDATVTLREDEASVPTDLDAVAARQLGTLACVWGGTDKTDGGYDEGLQLYIAPDSAAAFASNLPKIEAAQTPTAENTAGDASEYLCSVDSGVQCAANMLVGSYWVTAYLQGQTSKVTQTVADSTIQQVMDTTSQAIKSAGALRQAWTPPKSDEAAFCSDQNSTDAVKTAFSSSGVVATNSRSGMVYDADTVAQSDPSYSACYWQQPGSSVPTGQFGDIQIETLRAGAWAFRALLASPPTNWYVGAYAPIAIPGATAAISACNNADCDAIFEVGTTAVEVSFDNLGVSRTTTSLTALVNAMRLG